MVVFLAILALLSWQHQKQGVPLPKTTPEIGQSSSNTPNAPAVTLKQTTQPPSPAPSSANQLPVVNVNDHEKTNEIRQYLESQNKPVEFFGKIIDQDGNPLAGVKIKGEVLHLKVIVPAAWGSQDEIIPIDKDTDQNGRFEIQGMTGRGVVIESIQKDGYEVEPTSRSHGTAEGSLSSPVVFKMWSTNIHEPLITGGNKFQIVPDGRPYFIDLTKGTIAEPSEGDLKVWIQYTNQPIRGQSSDWSAEIDVVNGGLQETKDYSMFTAPTEGYVSSFFWKDQIKGGQRGNIGERRFYLKLKNGQEYGRMVIELHAPFNNQIPGLIRLSYAINPSGSRILR
jgi:hypothetical protein